MHYDNYNLHCVISIHALLAESDLFDFPIVPVELNFYPRSPCGERHRVLPFFAVGRYFYPRSPCGERLQLKPPIQTHRQISIHALLAESDILTRYQH